MKSIKRATFLLFNVLFLAWTTSTRAQIIDGDVILTTQSEVNSFVGTSINGSLTIQGEDIVDLTPLITIIAVGGDLIIQTNTILTNLDSLSNLSSFGGSILISSNAALTNLNGLNNATSVSEGHLSVEYNNALTDLSLTNLTAVGFDVIIRGNSSLINLNLGNLNTVGEHLTIDGNASLSNLDGLSNLTTVGRDFWVDNNVQLTDFDGLSNLTSVGEYMTVSNNTKLTNLDGFLNLSSVGARLYVASNDALTNLSLSNCTSVGGDLQVTSNASLANLSMNNLITVGGGLYLNANDVLSSLGFSNLTSIGGNMSVDNNAALSAFSLSNLTYVGGNMSVDNNAALIDFSLVYLTSVGGLEIISNALLTDIEGLAELINVGGEVSIQENPVLTNIDLSNLTSVGTDLSVNYNTALTNLSFSNLTSLGESGNFGFGSLSIIENPVLATFTLGGLTSVGVNLTVSSNALLTNLNGLSNVTSLSELTVSSNDALTDLDGLGSLTSVTAELNISSNATLKNLNGLTQLLAVGILTINNNALLTNLNGLRNLASVGFGMSVLNNTDLYYFCGLHTLLSTGGLQGVFNVSGNFANPTPQQVIDGGACPAPSTDAEIIDFSFSEQTGAAILGSGTVTIEVANGTSLTSIIPTITLSDNATINPSGGVAQDFTNPVSYTVTAEDGITTQEWSVIVNVAPSNQTAITNFSFPEQTGAAVLGSGTVYIEVANGTNLTSIIPTITLSDNATINPSSGVAQDFTNPVSYLVTAEDENTTQEWLITVIILSNQTAITNFSFSEQTGAPTLGSGTVAIEVTNGTSLTSIIPTITLSDNATINPSSGVAQNFTNPVTYTVTAEDGNAMQEWVITVTVAPSNQTAITNFSFSEETGAAVLGSGTVSIEVANGTSLTSIIPTIALSDNATINPSSGVAQDFTNPVSYIVTAEDGNTTQEWLISVTEEVILGIEVNHVFNVYPNPANQQLKISLDQFFTEVVSISIFDFSGRIMEKRIVNGLDQQTFNIDTYQAGVYLIEIRDLNKQYSARFIKN